MNYEELTIQELRTLAKKKSIDVDKKDTKLILIEKIKDRATKEVKREAKLINVRTKMAETRKVIVTKLNPEDTVRDSILVPITNATGSFTTAVPFNLEVNLPLPIIDYLKKKKYQGFRKVSVPRLGTIDQPIILPEFNVQEV